MLNSRRKETAKVTKKKKIFFKLIQSSFKTPGRSEKNGRETENQLIGLRVLSLINSSVLVVS